MASAQRLLAVVPLVGLLGWSAIHAVQFGLAGSAASAGAREAQTLALTGGMESWWYSDLRRAATEVPRDPSVRELLGFVAVRDGAQPLDVQAVERHLQAAIEARPGSGYTWATWMELKYRTGDTGAAFEKALLNAARLAPYEPEVQQTVADYGLAVIDEVTPPARAAIERIVAAGMKRNASEILQIASRRGRLDAACRYLDVVPRPAESKWTKLCESMEATS